MDRAGLMKEYDDAKKIAEMLASTNLYIMMKGELADALATQIISPWSISDERSEELDSLKYADYLKTREWQEIRYFMREVFARCSCCNSTKSLDVHHNCYPTRGTERPIDLTLLCRKCHAKIHGRSTRR